MTPSHDTPVATPSKTLTLRAAAERVGVSMSTVRRRKDALIAAGAEVTSVGWSIPVAALEAVFVLPLATPSATPVDTPSATPSESDLVEQLRSENAFLRQQVEQQARTIERQAEAHAVISAQLTRLGQLEAGDSAESAVPTRAPEKPAPQRRWWQRRNRSS